MTRMMVWPALIVAALCVVSAPAPAQNAACKTEIEKLCPGMTPGDGKYGQCLVDHEKDFSSPCKKYAEAAAARKRDLKEFPACIADAERLCPGMAVGLTRLTKCLRMHQSDLSADCKHEIRKRRGQP